MVVMYGRLGVAETNISNNTEELERRRSAVQSVPVWEQKVDTIKEDTDDIKRDLAEILRELRRVHGDG